MHEFEKALRGIKELNQSEAIKWKQAKLQGGYNWIEHTTFKWTEILTRFRPTIYTYISQKTRKKIKQQQQKLYKNRIQSEE